MPRRFDRYTYALSPSHSRAYLLSLSLFHSTTASLSRPLLFFLDFSKRERSREREKAFYFSSCLLLAREAMRRADGCSFLRSRFSYAPPPPPRPQVFAREILGETRGNVDTRAAGLVDMLIGTPGLFYVVLFSILTASHSMGN